MTNTISETTLSVCRSLLGEYAEKGAELDTTLFKNIPPSEAREMIPLLNHETEISITLGYKDLVSLSGLFSAIGAYTIPFTDTKTQFGQEGIYRAADEFAAFVEKLTHNKGP